MSGDGQPDPVVPEASAPKGAQASGSTLHGRLIAERYQVLERIGQGGMGSVYRALHVHMKKQVALKVLHREMTQQAEAVTRFEREAIAAGRVDHPNVAKATDFGRLEDGSFYLVLEYVEGKTLSALLRERSLSTEETLLIAKQISEALSAAHAAGIVHRDLKPDNVMLVEHAGEPLWVKVLDFGIAKVGSIESGSSRIPLTRMGSVFGTPEYMAPEQASGGTVDVRTDLYALGILLYRMLSGREPFVDPDVSKVLMQQITQAPADLPEPLSAGVKDLVADLLCKDPDGRIQTADETCARILYCQMQLNEKGPRRMLSKLRIRFEVARLRGMGALASSLRRPGRAKASAMRIARWCKQRVGGLAKVPLTRQFVRFLSIELLLGRRTFKIWQGLTGVSLVLGVLWVALPSAREDESTIVAPQAPSAVPRVAPILTPPAAEQSKVLSDAALGKPEAIAAIEQRPASERSTEEWLALGRGRAVLLRYSGAVEAYQEAIVKNRSLSQNPEVVRTVWAAAQRSDAAQQALRLAAQHLGERGADLLYKAWVDLSKSVTPTTALAKELVYGASVREVASPALAIALDLRSAQSCAQVAPLLPKVILQGDARSLRVLKRVQDELECKELEQPLKGAISAIKSRPEPQF